MPGDTRRMGQAEDRSLHWWKIMADREARVLIFKDFYEAEVGPDAVIELLAEDLEEIDPELWDDPEPWGEDSSMIEDWFAAGEDLDQVEAWEPLLADGWEDGVVLRRPSPRLAVRGANV